jgi:hypothetical protein
VKTYLTGEDYFAGNAAVHNEIEFRKIPLVAAPGEFTYYVSSPKRELNFNIKKKYWAIERNDSLFLHCNKTFNTRERNKRSRYKISFRDDVYAHVLFRSSGYLHFRAGRTNLPGVPPSRYDVNESAMVNALNEAMEPEREQQRFNYLYDHQRKEVVYLNRGVMRQYLARSSSKDSLLREYISRLIAAED